MINVHDLCKLIRITQYRCHYFYSLVLIVVAGWSLCMCARTCAHMCLCVCVCWSVWISKATATLLSESPCLSQICHWHNARANWCIPADRTRFKNQNKQTNKTRQKTQEEYCSRSKRMSMWKRERRHTQGEVCLSLCVGPHVCVCLSACLLSLSVSVW